MKLFKQYLALVVSVMITGLGAAMSLKAAIGVGPWDALAQSLSYITLIKVGTVGMILNILCIFGQMILQKKDFKLISLLQFPIGILNGMWINYLYYDVLGPIPIESYGLRVVMFVVAILLIASSISFMMELNIVSFSLEAFCLALAEKYQLRFAHLRQLGDVLFVLISIALTLIFRVPFTLREGSILIALSFGPLLSFFMPKMEKILVKLDLI